MRKKVLPALFAFSLFFALFPLNPANAHSQPEKEWTFLIYLNGNNSLDSFGAQNLSQMEKVGSTDQINIVVQWASLASKKVERLYIQKGNDPSKITSPVIQDLGSVDMGDWKTLEQFIQWGVAAYPAQHYFINVWDHGSGWHDIRSMSMFPMALRPMDISWDDNTGHSITTQELGQVMADATKFIGHKVDIYGSDACLMAMAEVAEQMSGSVGVFVGSEETEPGAGWPYDTFLKRWVANSSMTAEQVGAALVNEYAKSYEGGSNGTEEVTFSAFNLDKMGELNQAVALLGEKLSTLDKAARAQIVSGIGNTQTFTDSDYGDLGDFANAIDQAKIPELDAKSIANVKQAIQDFVIANGVTPRYSKAMGVSIWLPADLDTYNSYADKYHMLKFQSVTKWGDALRYILQ